MRRIRTVWRIATTAFTVAAVVYAVRTKQPSGRFLRVPYDFRFPTLARFRERIWNPDDPSIVTPTVFGVGWALNLYQARELIRMYLAPPKDVKTGREQEPQA